jgi:hypothetical protein
MAEQVLAFSTFGNTFSRTGSHEKFAIEEEPSVPDELKAVWTSVPT